MRLEPAADIHRGIAVDHLPEELQDAVSALLSALVDRGRAGSRPAPGGQPGRLGDPGVRLLWRQRVFRRKSRVPGDDRRGCAED